MSITLKVLTVATCPLKKGDGWMGRGNVGHLTGKFNGLLDNTCSSDAPEAVAGASDDDRDTDNDADSERDHFNGSEVRDIVPVSSGWDVLWRRW